MAEVDYQKIVYEARDILKCGHVAKVPDELEKLHTRYNDALARIATLERAVPNTTIDEVVALCSILETDAPKAMFDGETVAQMFYQIISGHSAQSVASKHNIEPR